MGISTKTKYENQSKYYSASIHNHTNLSGDTARATSPARITEKDTQDELAAEQKLDEETCDKLMCRCETNDKEKTKEQGGRSSPENLVSYRKEKK